ncbi:MAG TPA: hypothetical protein VF407_06105 [Polyangiaceae bacterium]
MNPQELAARAAQGAQRLIAIIAQNEGITLDFGGHSLGQLDAIVERRRQEWMALTIFQREDLEQLVGCFLGECLVRIFGGTWGWMNEPAVRVIGAKGEHHIAFPFSKAKKHVELGEHESIWKFFLSFGALCGRFPASAVPTGAASREDSAEEDDDDLIDKPGEEWCDPTAIVGAFQSADDAVAAFNAVLDELGYDRQNGPGDKVQFARLVPIAHTFWIALDSDMALTLGAMLDRAYILGVQTTNVRGLAESVVLYELAENASDPDQIVVARAHGLFPDARDVQAARVDWESRFACRALGVPEHGLDPRMQTLLYYTW